jgi:hypothetical protein
VSWSSFPVTRFEEPFVSAAVGATASAPELHCLMNRPGITAPVAAADAGVCAAAPAGAFCLGGFVCRCASFDVRAARRRAVRQCQVTWVALFGGGGSPSNNHWSGP